MKATMKKVLSVLLVVALTAGIAIGGTLAYLTDRDSEANVFTVGDVSINLNEKFEQGAELIPGVRIEKEATITNTGKNDAWVWMTVAVPAVLDDENTELGSANVLHWNMPGCFWNGYHDQDKYIQSGIKDGYLPEGSTGVADEDSWINDNKAVKETINGIEYNVYTFKYVGAIVPGETTNIGLSKVFLDENLDIAPDGQWYIVENGTATKVNWNSNTDGNPVVYVSAYAIQAEGFETVQDAYNAYNKQWGTNGTEYAAVSTAEELENALTSGGSVVLTDDVALTSDTTVITADATINLGNNVLSSVGRIHNAENTTAAEISTLVIGEGADVVLNAEEGGVVNNEYGYGICLGGGTLTVNGGTYTAGGATAIQVSTGTLNINGGFFDLTGEQTWDYKYLINCIDANYKNGTAKIVITGGTFVGFDPSADPEGEGTSYVADGYKVVSETKDNGEIWYTVVPA